jgi:ankyrin repeat protein
MPRRAAVLLLVLVLSILTSCSRNVIFDAVQNDDLEKVKMLLKGNPDLVFSKDTTLKETPLHYAVVSVQNGVVQLLLAKKAEVNARNNAGETPLLLMAQDDGLNENDATNVVELLIAKGANVNVKDNKGQTPLEIAEFWSNEDVAQLLRQHGGHK